MFVLWVLLLSLRVLVEGINIDRLFCESFKDQSVYHQLDLQADGCSLNIFYKEPDEICLMNPDDNDVFLEGTCQKKELIYVR